MKAQIFWTIVKKEFFSYLNSAVAYVILVPFLVLNAFLFLRSALVLSDANLRPMIELLPWFLMIIGPALSMRAFSEERRRDTLELVFSHPVPEWILVAAKFTGLLMFYMIMLAATLPLAVTIVFYSTPDIGLLLSQYVGAFFVGAVFIAVGLSASALIGSAVGGFLFGTAINFLLILIGMSFVTLMFPGVIGRFINEIAIMPHINSISRGVLDFRDLLYFGTLITISLTLAVIKLSERKVAELPSEKRKLTLVMGLTLLVAVLGNILVYAYPLRWDMTSSKRYSLSPGTKQLLRNLPDRVNVTLYTSQNLPGPMQVTLRETTDWLKDFRNYGKKVSLRTVLTDENPSNKTEAQQRGIREVQFNQIGASSFQVQTGFLGIEVRFGDKTEVIDFIEDSSNLEYQLSRILVKLTQEKQNRIGLWSSPSMSTQELSNLLSNQYDVVELTDDTKTEDIAGLTGIIAVDDGLENNATIAAQIKTYLNNGGNVMAMVNGISVDQSTLETAKSQSELANIFADFGVTINFDLVYDSLLNEPVTLGAGSVRYIMPYPYWIRSLVKKSSLPFNDGITNVLLGWASSIEIKSGADNQVFPLLTTGEKSGGVSENITSVNPQDTSKLPQPSGEKLVGAAIIKNNQRIEVIADADIVSDDFLKNSPENQQFVSNSIDWVAADPLLSQISRRGSSRNLFKFQSNEEVNYIQLVNIAGPAVLTAGFGVWWLLRRKRMTKRVYAEANYEN